MKKIISLSLVFALFLSLGIVSVGAEEKAFTMEDAYALYLEALERFSIFQGGGCYHYVDDDPVTLKKQCIAYNSAAAIRYHTSSDGKAYNDEDGYLYAPFFTVPDFPSDFKTESPYISIDEDFNYVFKSIDDVKIYFGEVFTDAMVERSMYICPELKSADRIEMFRYSEKNELLLYYTYSEYGLVDMAEILRAISLKVNKNKAILMVKLLAYGIEAYPESVEFIKENGVWKVSGGTVFGYFLGDNMDNTLNYNPSTGDASAYTVPALALTAIISIALPTSILRKRRRVV